MALTTPIRAGHLFTIQDELFAYGLGARLAVYVELRLAVYVELRLVVYVELRIDRIEVPTSVVL